jgi:hypothetical protein
VISPSKGRYLHTGQHKHGINAHTDIHALSGIRTPIPAFERAKTAWPLCSAYCTLTTRNYNCNVAKITITHASLLSMLQPPLIVAWLQSSNNRYSSSPDGLRTAPPNRGLKTAVLCPWLPIQGPGPLFSDLL